MLPRRIAVAHGSQKKQPGYGPVGSNKWSADQPRVTTYRIVGSVAGCVRSGSGQERLLGFLGPQAAFQLDRDVREFLRQVSEPHQAKVMQRREDHDLAA